MGRKMSRVTRISPSVEQVDGSSVRRVVSKFKPSVVQVGTCKRESAAIPYNCIPLRQLTTTCKWWSVPIGTAWTWPIRSPGLAVETAPAVDPALRRLSPGYGARLEAVVIGCG